VVFILLSVVIVTRPDEYMVAYMLWCTVYSSCDWTSLSAWDQCWSRLGLHLSALQQTLQFRRCQAQTSYIRTGCFCQVG